MSTGDVTARLLAYIEENLVPDGLAEPINETSHLLELGVLDSLKTAMLLNFIRDQLGVRIPPLMIEFENFKDVRSISAIVSDLLVAAPVGSESQA
jgi:acyl carrier protein